MSITNLMRFLLSWGYLHGMKDRSSNYRSDVPWLRQPVVPKEVVLILIHRLFSLKNLLLEMGPMIFLKSPLEYIHMDSQISLGYCSSKIVQPVLCCSLLYARAGKMKSLWALFPEPTVQVGEEMNHKHYVLNT